MPSGKNAWSLFVTFNLLKKFVILHALLAATMTNILLVFSVLEGLPVKIKNFEIHHYSYMAGGLG